MKYSYLKDLNFVAIEFIGGQVRPKLRSYTDEDGNYAFNLADVNALLLFAIIKGQLHK